MQQWITRRTTEGAEVAPPQCCYEPGAIEAEPGLLTIEQYIVAQLEAGEICDSQGRRRSIIRGRQYVGYFEITSRRP